jgi:hypothetical protein
MDFYEVSFTMFMVNIGKQLRSPLYNKFINEDRNVRGDGPGRLFTMTALT